MIIIFFFFPDKEERRNQAYMAWEFYKASFQTYVSIVLILGEAILKTLFRYIMNERAGVIKRN